MLNKPKKLLFGMVPEFLDIPKPSQQYIPEWYSKSERFVGGEAKIKPDVFLIEYHSSENRRTIDKILKNYILLESSMRNYNYGIQKYVNKKLIN